LVRGGRTDGEREIVLARAAGPGRRTGRWTCNRCGGVGGDGRGNARDCRRVAATLSQTEDLYRGRRADKALARGAGRRPGPASSVEGFKADKGDRNSISFYDFAMLADLAQLLSQLERRKLEGRG